MHILGTTYGTDIGWRCIMCNTKTHIYTSHTYADGWHNESTCTWQRHRMAVRAYVSRQNSCNTNTHAVGKMHAHGKGIGWRCLLSLRLPPHPSCYPSAPGPLHPSFSFFPPSFASAQPQPYQFTCLDKTVPLPVRFDAFYFYHLSCRLPRLIFFLGPQKQ